MSVVITTGNDTSIVAVLKRDDATFIIDSADVVKAILTDVDRTEAISPQITIDLLATGTDLANSKIIVEFSDTDTAAITSYGEALMAIQLTADSDGSKTTWWVDGINIVQGFIT